MVAAFERERAASLTHEDVLERVGVDDIHLIDLVFSDIAGGAKAMTIPVALLPQTLGRGYRFDGSALMGGMRKVELDLYLAPDPSTLMIFPPEDGHRRRGRLCCSVLRRDGLPFDGDPRSVLERALKAARDLGFDYHVGIEMEFYLVRGDWTEPMPARDAAGYFDVGEDVVSRTRDGVLTTLQEIGVAVGGAHHETGPGQEEIDLIGTDALQMADHLITVRQVIRSVAQRSGLRASFMPKPFADAPGSGLHMFQRLRRFPDNSDALKNVDDSLSTVAYKMIAGQLNHAAGMCAVLCPTVNSYKRLNAGHRAPRHATWAHVSQSSLIRVPSWGSGEEAAIELRCPDSMANPYLAMAVALSAAMSGIKSSEEPPDPLEESFSAYDDAGMQRIGVPRLPGTLGEAIQAMTQDQLIHDALGSYVYDQLLTVKQTEWEEYRAHVSPWEHRRYGDV